MSSDTEKREEIGKYIRTQPVEVNSLAQNPVEKLNAMNNDLPPTQIFGDISSSKKAASKKRANGAASDSKKKRAKKDPITKPPKIATKPSAISPLKEESSDGEERIDTLFSPNRHSDENNNAASHHASLKSFTSPKKGAATPQEDRIIMEAMSELATQAASSKWKFLAQKLDNGRTADFVRHRWNIMVKKAGEGKLCS